MLTEATDILRRLAIAGRLGRLEAAKAARELALFDLEPLPFEPFASRVWELRGSVGPTAEACGVQPRGGLEAEEPVANDPATTLERGYDRPPTANRRLEGPFVEHLLILGIIDAGHPDGLAVPSGDPVRSPSP